MAGASPSLEHAANDSSNDVGLTSGDQKATPKRGFSFWIIFFAICLSLFMSALEAVRPCCSHMFSTLTFFHYQTGTSTALPTIVADLQGDDFVWVGSSYSLAATALLPASGGVAEVSSH